MKQVNMKYYKPISLTFVVFFISKLFKNYSNSSYAPILHLWLTSR